MTAAFLRMTTECQLCLLRKDNAGHTTHIRQIVGDAQGRLAVLRCHAQMQGIGEVEGMLAQGPPA